MKRRTLLGGLAGTAVLGTTALTACTSTVTDKSDDGRTILRLFGGDRGVKDMATNDYTKIAEEKFGVSFEFQLVKGADVVQKQAVLMNSGDYPEFIWHGAITSFDAQKYGKQGVFVDMAPLLRDHAPNVWNTLQANPNLAGSATTPDGKIFGLPKNLAQYQNYWVDKMWVNLKQLDRLGLDLPRTTDEFAQVLAEFKGAGLTPLTGSVGGYAMDPTTFLMNAFLPTNARVASSSPGGFDTVTDGRVGYAAVTEEWRDGLRYLQALFSKGYFDKGALTQQTEPVQQLLSSDKVAMVPNGAIETILPGSKLEEINDWMAIPALKGPQGVQSASFRPIQAGSVFAITDKATENQQLAIMKMLDDQWATEGTQIMNYGPKGDFWTDADTGTRGRNGQPATIKMDITRFGNPTSIQNAGWNQFGPINSSDDWWNSQEVKTTFDQQFGCAIHLYTVVGMVGHQAPQQFPPALWLEGNDVQEFSTLNTNLSGLAAQRSSQFIVGDRNLDKDWSAYLDEMKRLGLPRYLELAQAAMTQPLDATDPSYDVVKGNVDYLVKNGPIPDLVRKYLVQAGVPESSFSK